MQRGRGAKGRGGFTYKPSSGAPTTPQQGPASETSQPSKNMRNANKSNYGQNQAYTRPHEFHGRNDPSSSDPSIGPLLETGPKQPNLLTDEQIKSFLLNGYVVVQATSLRSSFHKYIIQQMQNTPQSDKYGNNCLPAFPALNQVYEDPTVKGALISLLGPKCGMHPHRAVHFSPPGKSTQQWHRDTFWGYKLPLRYPRPWMVMGMYYPQATTIAMGATGAKPGTHFYTIDPKRYTGNFPNHFKDDDERSDTRFECPEGSVAIIHYDLIHKGTANSSQANRYMFKFQFYRTEVPTEPSWNCQNPEWIPFSPSDSVRKRAIEPLCQSVWEWMCGNSSKFYSKETKPLAQNEINELVGQLDHQNEWTRFYAAFKLALTSNTNALAMQLLHPGPSTLFLSSHPDEQLRFCAAYALALMPQPPSDLVETLTSWCLSKPAETQVVCLFVLGEWGLPEMLISNLNSLKAVKDETTMLYLVQALGRLNSKEADTLASLLHSHNSDQVRMMSSMSLDLLATSQPKSVGLVISELQKGLHNYNRYVQAYCLNALVKLESPEAKQIALSYLMATRWCSITTTENTF